MWTMFTGSLSKIFFFFCSNIIAPQVKQEYEEKLLIVNNKLAQTEKELAEVKAINDKLRNSSSEIIDALTPVIDGDKALDAITRPDEAVS